MSKISKEKAMEEITSWLDFKKVSDNKREVQKDTIETLVDAISDGSLVLTEDKSLLMKLKFPVEAENDMGFSELKFRPRLKTETVQKHLQGVKPSDVDGRLTAYIAALTSTPKSSIVKMDSEDTGLASAIAVFFL